MFSSSRFLMHKPSQAFPKPRSPPSHRGIGISAATPGSGTEQPPLSPGTVPRPTTARLVPRTSSAIGCVWRKGEN